MLKGVRATCRVVQHNFRPGGRLGRRLLQGGMGSCKAPRASESLPLFIKTSMMYKEFHIHECLKSLFSFLSRKFRLGVLRYRLLHDPPLESSAPLEVICG